MVGEKASLCNEFEKLSNQALSMAPCSVCIGLVLDAVLRTTEQGASQKV
jgi:hypothetical protein